MQLAWSIRVELKFCFVFSEVRWLSKRPLRLSFSFLGPEDSFSHRVRHDWATELNCPLIVTIAEVNTFGSVNFFVREKWRPHLSVSQFFQALFHNLSCSPLWGHFCGRWHISPSPLRRVGGWQAILGTALSGRRTPHPRRIPSQGQLSVNNWLVLD